MTSIARAVRYFVTRPCHNPPLIAVDIVDERRGFILHLDVRDYKQNPSPAEFKEALALIMQGVADGDIIELNPCK